MTGFELILITDHNFALERKGQSDGIKIIDAKLPVAYVSTLVKGLLSSHDKHLSHRYTFDV